MRLAPLAIGLAVLLTVGLAAGPAAVAAQDGESDHNPDEIASAYNQNVDQLPDVIKNRAANERVELQVERSNGEVVTYTAITDEDARVTEIREGSHDPSIRVTTDEETIREVANAEDTPSAAAEAYKSDDVQVEGVGTVNTVTIEAVKIGHAIGEALGLL